MNKKNRTYWVMSILALFFTSIRFAPIEPIGTIDYANSSAFDPIIIEVVPSSFSNVRSPIYFTEDLQVTAFIDVSRGKPENVEVFYGFYDFVTSGVFNMVGFTKAIFDMGLVLEGGIHSGLPPVVMHWSKSQIENAVMKEGAWNIIGNIPMKNEGNGVYRSSLLLSEFPWGDSEYNYIVPPDKLLVEVRAQINNREYKKAIEIPVSGTPMGSPVELVYPGANEIITDQTPTFRWEYGASGEIRRVVFLLDRNDDVFDRRGNIVECDSKYDDCGDFQWTSSYTYNKKLKPGIYVWGIITSYNNVIGDADDTYSAEYRFEIRESEPISNEDHTSTIMPSQTPTRTSTPIPTPSQTPTRTVTLTSTLADCGATEQVLYLDKNYYCREEPDKNSEKVWTFSRGEELRLLESRNGWYQIEFHDSRTRDTTCWIGGGIVKTVSSGNCSSSSSTSSSDTSSQSSGSPKFTFSENAFCRAGTSSSQFEEVWTFYSGDTVDIIGKDGTGWYKIEFHDSRTNDTTCWVWSGVGNTQGNASSISVVSTPEPPSSGVVVWVLGGSGYSHSITLSCDQVLSYTWRFNWIQSGEYWADIDNDGNPDYEIEVEDTIAACPGIDTNIFIDDDTYQ